MLLKVSPRVPRYDTDCHAENVGNGSEGQTFVLTAVHNHTFQIMSQDSRVGNKINLVDHSKHF